MTDLSGTIAPKSQQLNSDDLIGRTLTITITKVSSATSEQPIAINFEDDRGKPYYPCKGMRRVMVMVWGPDGSQYVGRAMTLYRDPKVKFGGIEVGGIRISHMSHIERDQALAIAETKGAKKVFQVKVLRQQQSPQAANTQQSGAATQPVRTGFSVWLEQLHVDLTNAISLVEVQEIAARPGVRSTLNSAKVTDEQKQAVNAAIKTALDRFEEEPFPGDLPADDDVPFAGAA